MTNDFSWLQLFAAALGGGLTVKIVDIAYQEYARRRESSASATKFLDRHIDPLLKAADELNAKLVSLARQDFAPLVRMKDTLPKLEDSDLSSLLFLLVRFWARIEIIRQEGLSISVSKDPRGKKLQAFFSSLESEKIRLVDRISQRAAGEILITQGPDYLKNLGFLDFVTLFEDDPRAQRWIMPVARLLQTLEHTSSRQILLQYGVIVHALIDTLDPDHVVTGARPSYPSKLSEKTKKGLRFRVFKVYLPFVPNREKYLSGDPIKG